MAPFAECSKQRTTLDNSKVEAFEKAVAQYCGADYAIGFNSRAAAYQAVVFAVAANSFDRILLSANDSIHAVVPFLHAGTFPVLIDIDQLTGGMLLPFISEKLKYRSSRGRNILLVKHSGGVLAPMHEISRLSCNPEDLFIEDATEALGLQYPSGEKVGCCQYSQMTVLGFSRIGSFSRGAVVLTGDEQIKKRLCLFRDYGFLEARRMADFDKLFVSREFYKRESVSLMDCQVEKGWVVLEGINDDLNVKKTLIKVYRKELGRLRSMVLLPPEIDHEAGYTSFIVHAGLGTRDSVLQRARKKGLDLEIPAPPLYRHPAIANGYSINVDDYSGAEQYCCTALELPLGPDLSEADVVAICQTLKKTLR